MNLLDSLMKVGLTKHESLLYIALCKDGELTGYEAAKTSGIPRSNAYLALAGLVEKGAAYKIESEVVKYIAVKPGEFAFNIRREMEEAISCIERDMPAREKENESFINISGSKNIIHKMKNIIAMAEERIYLSMPMDTLDIVKIDISNAATRGLKVVVITDAPIEMAGITVYCHPKQPGQIRLIADTADVLTGELGKTERNAACLYSKNINLVQLIKDSLTNEIKLIELEKK